MYYDPSGEFVPYGYPSSSSYQPSSYQPPSYTPQIPTSSYQPSSYLLPATLPHHQPPSYTPQIPTSSSSYQPHHPHQSHQPHQPHQPHQNQTQTRTQTQRQHHPAPSPIHIQSEPRRQNNTQDNRQNSNSQPRNNQRQNSNRSFAIRPPISQNLPSISKFDPYDPITKEITEKIKNLCETIDENDKKIIAFEEITGEVFCEIANFYNGNFDPSFLLKPLEEKLVQYYNYAKRDLTIGYDPMMVLSPNILKLFLQSSKEEEVLDSHNLYWSIIYCVQNGLYKSWTILRKHLMNIGYPEMELFFDWSKFSGYKIITEASSLGLKDNRFEYGIVLFQRLWRKKFMTEYTIEKEHMTENLRFLTKLKNLLSVPDLPFDNQKESLLRYNKGLYPLMFKKMTNTLVSSNNPNEQTWIMAYETICPEISQRYQMICDQYIELFRIFISDWDMFFKIEEMLKFYHLLCPDYSTYDPTNIHRNSYFYLTKLRFNVQTVTESYQNEPGQSFNERLNRVKYLSYRQAQLFLNLVPWFTVSWSTNLLLTFLKLDYKKLSDSEIRFWFFNLVSSDIITLINKYHKFNIDQTEFHNFLSGPIVYPSGLTLPDSQYHIIKYKDGLPYTVLKSNENIPSRSSATTTVTTTVTLDRKKKKLFNILSFFRNKEKSSPMKKVRSLIIHHFEVMKSEYKPDNITGSRPQAKDHKILLPEIKIEPVPLPGNWWR
jgi:hypothetical protein